MTYCRVVPRDLFNEASLLKCLGRLYIVTEGPGGVTLTEPDGSEPFIIEQNPATGGIVCANVIPIIRGERCVVERPLNSREPWPLYLTYWGTEELDEPVPVFTDDGDLTDAMERFIAGEDE